MTLPTKVLLVRAMVSPVVMYGCENWSIKKAECPRTDAFKLRCWRRLLRVPWAARRSNQSILKEISPEYSLEVLMLKLTLQYFGYLRWEPTHWKRPWRWERVKEGGESGDRGRDGWWHHWLSGHEFEQAPEMVKNREAWCAAGRGVTKSWSILTEWVNNNNVVSKIFNYWRAFWSF